MHASLLGGSSHGLDSEHSGVQIEGWADANGASGDVPRAQQCRVAALAFAPHGRSRGVAHVGAWSGPPRGEALPKPPRQFEHFGPHHHPHEPAHNSNSTHVCFVTNGSSRLQFGLDMHRRHIAKKPEPFLK